MGHVVEIQDYSDEKCRTKAGRMEIQCYWDKVAAYDNRQEGATGLCKKIEWRKEMKPFLTKEDAEDYIGKHFCDGNYQQVAVPYYDGPTSKKLQELTDKIYMLNKKYDEAKDAVYYLTHPIKAQLLTCKHCGTKISMPYFLKSYYNKNICPVCNTDLRPKSELQKFERLKEQIKKLKEKEVELKRKEFSKSRWLRWLVKVEWHV